MISRLLLLSLMFWAACSSPTEGTQDTDETVSIDGPLRLTVSDTPSPLGILFIGPHAAVAPSAITVSDTRYGSKCRYEVTGHADIVASTITLRVKYMERLTSCTAEIRALSYRAELSGLLGGSYDLNVIHEENNRSDRLLVQHIVMPP